MMVRNTGRIFARVLAVAFSLSFAGCQFSDLRRDRTEWDPPAPKNPVIVLATIDVSEGNSPGGLQMERLKPEPGEVFKKSWRYKFKGKDVYVLVNEDLGVGQYRVNELDVEAGPGIVAFDVKDDPRFQRTFSKPGVYFLGAYKFHVIMPPNRIGRMRFDLESVQGPGEREAIERILTAPELKNEYWKDLLTKRLKQLAR